MSSDWAFRFVSAVQRFICDTFDGPLDQAPDAARRFCGACPDPYDAATRAMLRSTLVEIAARWGYQRHQAVSARCTAQQCVPVSLGNLAGRWAGANAPPADQTVADKRIFVGWVEEFCRELQHTHPDTLAVRVAAIIERDCSRPLKMHDLARMVGANETSIRRDFHREYDISPRDFHLRARARRAEALLRGEPSSKVESIALELGWHSKKDLYRAIRRLRGCTPAALRDLSPAITGR